MKFLRLFMWVLSNAGIWGGTLPRALEHGVRVRRGAEYAVRLGSSTATGCYGVAFNDQAPYSGGASAISTDGGAGFTSEPARDLKFHTSVER
jgi:hypothetical protein